MPKRPRLSLCIPTYNRAACFQGALESGLRELTSLPTGTVEILVCDNASTDGTWNLVSKAQADHPELRIIRNETNLGFDRNYMRCVEEARGEFVWVMGDDDVWVSGSVARVMRELNAGADACLCLAEACDLDLKPLVVLPWYLDPDPLTLWRLESRDDLIRYFNACARTAGVFAFISVAIFRRDRFLANPEGLQRALDTGYPHLWGMMDFFRQPLQLAYIPEPLVRNRMSDLHASSYANTDLYGRWMLDLRSWAQIADAVFGDDSELHGAFSRILGRNHHNTILPGLRKCAPTEADWLQGVPYLVRAGFSPVQVAAVNFGFKHLQGDHLPMPTLEAATLCLVDLPLVARGAQHIAIMALGGLQNIFDGAGLLARLRRTGEVSRIRVFCTPECAELLDGFNTQSLEPKRYAEDSTYRECMARSMTEFSPELVVNLDPERGIEADDLVIEALPAGAIGYELPSRGQDPAMVKAVNSVYSCFVSPGAGSEGMLKALGLKPAPVALWPSAAAREQAREVLDRMGWDPEKTLAILVDHPSIPDNPAFQAALAQAAKSEWTFVGMGGRGTYNLLETLLDPLEGRAVNLAGILNLGSTAALLQLCGGFLGGTLLLQSLARACGCSFAPLKAIRP